MRNGLAGCTAVLAACLAVSGIAASANASSSSSPSGTSQSTSRAAAPATSAAPGGMYGELTGNAAMTVPQLRIRQTASSSASAAGSSGYQNYDDGETVCGVYANSAGMGSYCSDGTGTPLPPLIERFPGMHFENCRYEDPPAGVDVPPNPSPDEKMWQLRTCLTAINWQEWDGGDDRRVIMDLVLVDQDMDTSYEETELSRFLWNSRQTNYPIPMLRVEPKTYPVVHQEAYFTFDWLDAEKRTPVRDPRGPYKNAENGGPYVEHHNGNVTMRAEAHTMTIDPQVEGMKPKTCDPGELDYQESKDAIHTEQRSDCWFKFPRSSAAAPEISTADSYLDGDRYVFRPRIEVTWDVEYSRPGGGFQSLGDGYEMVVLQDLPVQEIQALNQPVAPDLYNGVG